MKDHAKDEWVQTMSKLVLGNKDFEARFDAAKVTFQKVAAFRRSPSKFQPITGEWEKVRTNKEWEIYCNEDRYKQLGGGQLWRDTAKGGLKRYFDETYRDHILTCFDTNFKAGSGVAAPKMTSLNSNILDRAGFNQAKAAGLNPKAEDYTKETQFASSTDVCTWFISKAVNDGWRKVDEDSVKKVMSDDFRTGLGGAPPVDGLKTIGFTFLHEATHTNQGGLLVDVTIPASLKQRIPSCYNWRCVVAMAKELEIKAETNADSIAMLALLLKLWKMGYYVDEAGVVHNIPA
ncbi:hypothetical protein LZ32DRAFT_654275 [Colletotrichum eremochloae]|nr:hypothetical protein LZ32DRAFT_654275 [Colletotrichum eremochloae]